MTAIRVTSTHTRADGTEVVYAWTQDGEHPDRLAKRLRDHGQTIRPVGGGFERDIVSPDPAVIARVVERVVLDGDGTGVGGEGT